MLIILFDNDDNRKEEMNSRRYREYGRHGCKEMAMMEHQGVGGGGRIARLTGGMRRRKGWRERKGWKDGWSQSVGAHAPPRVSHPSEKGRVRPAAP